MSKKTGGGVAYKSPNNTHIPDKPQIAKRPLPLRSELTLLPLRHQPPLMPLAYHPPTQARVLLESKWDIAVPMLGPVMPEFFKSSGPCRIVGVPLEIYGLEGAHPLAGHG